MELFLEQHQTNITVWWAFQTSKGGTKKPSSFFTHRTLLQTYTCHIQLLQWWCEKKPPKLTIGRFFCRALTEAVVAAQFKANWPPAVATNQAWLSPVPAKPIWLYLKLPLLVHPAWTGPPSFIRWKIMLRAILVLAFNLTSLKRIIQPLLQRWIIPPMLPLQAHWHMATTRHFLPRRIYLRHMGRKPSQLSIWIILEKVNILLQGCVILNLGNMRWRE